MSTAFVFAGGGVLGAVEVGMLEALVVDVLRWQETREIFVVPPHARSPVARRDIVAQTLAGRSRAPMRSPEKVNAQDARCPSHPSRRAV